MDDIPLLQTNCGTVTSLSPLQLENGESHGAGAQSRMLVTLSGIVTFVSPLQPLNA